MKLDIFDNKILGVLQENSDISNNLLAETVGLSPSACSRRVANLKRKGVIEGFVALVNPAYLGRNLTILVNIIFERHGPEYRERFISLVRKERSISECYMVTGAFTCFLILHVEDMIQYKGIIQKIFDSDTNVKSFTTHITVRTLKEKGVGV